MPPVAVPEADVRALLARWFPDQPATVERMGSGVSTPVYRVTVDGETVYLRLAERPGERREAEVRAHELARARGIAVPGVLRWEREPLELDRSAALTTAMPGAPLSAFGGDAADALRQAGCDLARLNAILLMGYGWADRVAGEDRRLVAAHRTRAAWAVEYRAAADTVIAARVLPDALCEPLTGAIRSWATLPDAGTSHLAHGDFDHTHIYVNPGNGRYQGLIDLGEIRGADRFYDLGHLLLHSTGKGSEAAFDAAVAGYGESTPVDLAAVRLQAIAIATRALAIQLGQTPNAYRAFLRERLGALLEAGR